MKNKIFSSFILIAISIVGILALLMSVSSFADQHGRGHGMGNGEGQGKNMQQESSKKYAQSFTPEQGLSDFEMHALAQMGEEEFVARDVYIVLYKKWEIKNFSNISKAEQRHADLVIDLTDAYGIENFSDHEVGVFENQELQQLYDDLVAKGLVSEEEALTVGAIIEDLDIYDLEKFLGNIENSDLKNVFERLNQGSRNHMRAFIKQLEKRGETYTPQYITPERFNTIIQGDHEIGKEHGDDYNNEDSSENSVEKKGLGKNQEEKESGFWAWIWTWILSWFR